MIRELELLDTALAMPRPFSPLWSIVDVRFGHLQDWPLKLIIERDTDRLCLTFGEVVSFRAHDGSEISHYWTTRDDEQVAVGSIYKVGMSTYRDEFAASTALMGQHLTHYLVCGFDLCVEVLSSSPPEIVLNVAQ